MAAWEQAPEVGNNPAWMAAPEVGVESSTWDSIKQGAGNLVAGAVRGAGSIGATLLAPVDIASDALAGKGLSLESNRQRRQAMDDALQSMGAEPDSLLYKGGKIGTEVLGTLGVGGAAAGGAAHSSRRRRPPSRGRYRTRGTRR